jgi:hypothetical protein
MAMMEKARIPLQIDIGFGDKITPGPEQIAFPSLLGQEVARLSAYPKETVIAEKLEAMVSLGEANSRMKDFYDIHFLSLHYAFDGDILRQAIAATFAVRRTVANAGSKLRRWAGRFKNETSFKPEGCIWTWSCGDGCGTRCWWRDCRSGR